MPISDEELTKLMSHIKETYGSVLAKLSQVEYNDTVKENIWMEEIVDSIIATVRFGEPSRLRNDLKAILDLVAEYQKEN